MGERTTSSKGNANQSGELALRLNGLEHAGRKFSIALSETFASHTGNMPKAPFLYNTVLSYNGSIRGSGSIIVGSALFRQSCLGSTPINLCSFA